MDTQGQRHDRIGILQPPGEHEHPPAPNYVPPRSGKDVDISVVQRMMSATIGSVLTSLLGTFCPTCLPLYVLIIIDSNTTRCRSGSTTITNSASAATKLRSPPAIPSAPAEFGRDSMLSRSVLGAESISVLCGFSYWHDRECF